MLTARTLRYSARNDVDITTIGTQSHICLFGSILTTSLDEVSFGYTIYVRARVYGDDVGVLGPVY